MAVEPPVVLSPSEQVFEDMLNSGRLIRKMFYGFTEIGEGGFGKVYKANYHIDQKVYAIKVVRMFIDKCNDPMA